MIWFFIGDLIDWLEEGRNISGVQRVSLELLYAAAECARDGHDFPFGTCCFDASRTGLAAVPTLDALRYFRHRRPDAAPSEKRPRRRGFWPFRFQHGPALASGKRMTGFGQRIPVPEKGAINHDPTDHFLFLGLVWSMPFRQLFLDLAAQGRSFSVLVYDLIQIQRPDLVDEKTGAEFATWLKIVLQTATNIVVPNAHTRQAILAWADASGSAVRPPIFPLQFGMSHLATKCAGTPGRPVSIGNYALSVGTIDRRKNQELLLRAWKALIECPGPHAVPQLVLAGRLDITVLEPELRRLVDGKHVLILEDASDAEIAALYASCRFTLFPSLAEGFGLPVAESLSFGKVCIASDLPEIRAFAGDLVWYFPPGSKSGALWQIRRALGSPDELMAAERHIVTSFVPPLWRDCALSMRDIARRNVDLDATL